MSRERLPWFPFYPADWLADERVQLMTCEQRGAYWQLLAYQGREGTVPAELDQLCALTGGSPECVQALLAQGLFPEVGRAGRKRRRNPRLARVLREQEKRAGEASARAKNAATARWRKDKRDAPSMPEAAPAQSHSDADSDADSESETRNVDVFAPGVCPLQCCDGEGAVRARGGRIMRTCQCPAGRERAKRFARAAEAEERARAEKPTDAGRRPRRRSAPEPTRVDPRDALGGVASG